ncbi:MAG: hypothetical protein ABIP08_06060 [Lautropia sp.]
MRLSSISGRCRTVALAAGLSMLAAGLPSPAAADDISDLRQALKELQEQNRALARRIATLETGTAAQRQAAPPPAQNGSPAAQAATATRPAAAVPPLRPDRPATPAELEQRVRELEIGKAAQQDATRSIIGSAFAKSGPKINEFLSLGGAVEVIVGRTQDYTGPPQSSVSLSTVELDFDVRVNQWLSGSLILAFDSGSNVLFPTSTGGTSGVDRITVDRALVTIGDPMRFPFYAKAGRDVLAFGSSTGVSRTSVLSLESPLTIQVFETRANSFGIGFEFPTPELTRAAPPVVVPPVQPLVVGPLVNRFANWIGYQPSTTRPAALLPFAAPPDPAPFYGFISIYRGNDLISQGQADLTRNINASLGYRTRGHCGRPYSELADSWVCPWSLDVSVDFNSSVFDSNFLQRGYAPFLNQIGYVPAIAANLKASVGPVSLVAEYNTALRPATFVDDLGTAVTMLPAAWQAALGYQFDWNPWVEKIGDQGTFVAIGYSQSQGLAGVTQLIGGVPTRTGFAPKSRLTLTAAEWVLEGLKLTLESSLNWDYPVNEGGTGGMSYGFFGGLTFTF